MVLPLLRLHDLCGERGNVPRWGAGLYGAGVDENDYKTNNRK